jgi:hypothetical protein
MRKSQEGGKIVGSSQMLEQEKEATYFFSKAADRRVFYEKRVPSAL